MDFPFGMRGLTCTERSKVSEDIFGIKLNKTKTNDE